LFHASLCAHGHENLSLFDFFGQKPLASGHKGMFSAYRVVAADLRFNIMYAATPAVFRLLFL
jgi:hypothetical protein